MCGHTQPLCGYTQQLYTLLENTFQGPTFIRGSLYNITHITTVCAHTITVYTNGKQLSVLHIGKQLWSPDVKQQLFFPRIEYKKWLWNLYIFPGS